MHKDDERDGGGFNLVMVAAARFRLLGLDSSRPYLQGQVELLPEDTGDEAAAQQAAARVQQAFRAYLATLEAQAAARVQVPSLPDDPVALSYVVAAAVIADLPVKQDLLAAPDALHRLAAERSLLAREVQMLRTLDSAPALDLRNKPDSSN